jgi:hypothetical protein
MNFTGNLCRLGPAEPSSAEELSSEEVPFSRRGAGMGIQETQQSPLDARTGGPIRSNNIPGNQAVDQQLQGLK